MLNNLPAYLSKNKISYMLMEWAALPGANKGRRSAYVVLSYGSSEERWHLVLISDTHTMRWIDHCSILNSCLLGIPLLYWNCHHKINPYASQVFFSYGTFLHRKWRSKKMLVYLIFLNAVERKNHDRPLSLNLMSLITCLTILVGSGPD